MDTPSSKWLNVLNSVLGRDCSGMALNTLLMDIAGFDSVVFVRLVVALDETTARELSESEVESIRTIRDVAQLLGETV